MPPSVIVVGAGIAGRLTSLRLADAGCAVTLIDRDGPEAANSCTYVGAGMLAPWCERETASELIFHLGLESLKEWKRLQETLPGELPLEQNGSLVVAHPADQADVTRLQHRIQATEQSDGMQPLNRNQLAELEPALSGRFNQGLFFPGEGHVDNRAFLTLTTQALTQHEQIVWHPHVTANDIQPHVVTAGEKRFEADWVIDCRGMGAKPSAPELRGVRGELMYLHAPDVHLHRPVRLMHPRHPLYIVPRSNNVYVVGATSIESEDERPVTVHSALELLSAAYSLDSQFAEASILEQASQLRPAFPDHEPRIHCAPGLLSINGLYRHGFLITPALVTRVCSWILHQEKDHTLPHLYHGECTCTSA